jgi:hypothetical protein
VDLVLLENTAMPLFFSVESDKLERFACRRVNYTVHLFPNSLHVVKLTNKDGWKIPFHVSGLAMFEYELPLIVFLFHIEEK